MAQNSQKAFLQTEKGDNIPCLFNPTELSFSRSNSWQAPNMPGKGVPTLNYSGANSGSMTLRLFFDSTDDGSPVTNYTDQLLTLMEIDSSLPGSNENSNNARPPWVQFNWGSMHSFKAVIASASVSFTYFSSQGVPLRADVDLTLTQYEDGKVFGPQNPTSGTPHPHRAHRVQPGETLDRIAATYYGSPTSWRSIADLNGIEDPMALRPGRILAIPELS
jgi:Contractile injection system tube protein/LysM domain